MLGWAFSAWIEPVIQAANNPLSATYNLQQMTISNFAAFSKNNK